MSAPTTIPLPKFFEGGLVKEAPAFLVWELTPRGWFAVDGADSLQEARAKAGGRTVCRRGQGPPDKNNTSDTPLSHSRK